MEIFSKYFPNLSKDQIQKLGQFKELLLSWNDKINVISRQDTGNIDTRHILFSLAIARYFSFRSGTRILDAGTGGGLPGIPLAIFFPDAEFMLVDSVGKKIRVVESIAGELGLHNVKAVARRAEEVEGNFDFITGRAVTAIPQFIKLIKKKISPVSRHEFPNGILYLKGGETDEDLKKIKADHRVFRLAEDFADPFFETKMLIHLFNIR